MQTNKKEGLYKGRGELRQRRKPGGDKGSQGQRQPKGLNRHLIYKGHFPGREGYVDQAVIIKKISMKNG